MARVTDEPASEGERGTPLTGSVKRKYSARKRRSPDVEQVEGEDQPKEHESEEEEEEGEDDEEDDEEEEEEYEIEQILDAKKGRFAHGRMGYFVKWKGYGEEHNSWVDEGDAGNAQDLISNFWAQRRRHKLGPRKSEPVKEPPKTTATKPARKSLAATIAEKYDEGVQKKRGRQKSVEGDSDIEEMEVDEDSRTKKKPKKNDVGAGQESISLDEIGSMGKHANSASWEHLVESVDTVERNEDGELYVYFTLKTGQRRVREDSRVCAEKFPQKLIKFYESNLRWKTED